MLSSRSVRTCMSHWFVLGTGKNATDSSDGYDDPMLRRCRMWVTFMMERTTAEVRKE